MNRHLVLIHMLSSQGVRMSAITREKQKRLVQLSKTRVIRDAGTASFSCRSFRTPLWLHPHSGLLNELFGGSI